MNQKLNDTKTTVSELRELVRQFVHERDWERFHNVKNLSMSLAIEAGELMEHTQWLTTEQVRDQVQIDKEAVAEELCDILSYALAIANVLDIDLSTSLERKMAKNREKYPVDSPRTAQGLPSR